MACQPTKHLMRQWFEVMFFLILEQTFPEMWHYYRWTFSKCKSKTYAKYGAANNFYTLKNYKAFSRIFDTANKISNLKLTERTFLLELSLLWTTISSVTGLLTEVKLRNTFAALSTFMATLMTVSFPFSGIFVPFSQ